MPNKGSLKKCLHYFLMHFELTGIIKLMRNFKYITILHFTTAFRYLGRQKSKRKTPISHFLAGIPFFIYPDPSTLSPQPGSPLLTNPFILLQLPSILTSSEATPIRANLADSLLNPRSSPFPFVTVNSL